ncbi:MAG: hypothetical protein GY903_21940 [Fuerstiella sp.]|nr:hypothetical protein [Fuerstiella sp.]
MVVSRNSTLVCLVFAMAVGPAGRASAGQLVAYWPMDEATGAAVSDAAGNGLDGAFTDGGRVSTGDGKIGGGLVFGEGDMASNLTCGNIDIKGSLSVAFWLKPARTGVWQRVVAKGHYNNGFQIGLAPGGQPEFAARADTGELVQVVGRTILKTGEWHHVVAAYDLRTRQSRLYINGHLDGKKDISSASRGIMANDNNLTIGHAEPEGGQFSFTGTVDEVSLYRGVLDTDAVAYLLKSGRARDFTLAGRGARARASNVFQQDLKTYNPQYAIDGDPQTRWAADAGTHEAWLEIELGQDTTFDTARITESVGARVEKFELQIKDGQNWKTIARGTTLGGGKAMVEFAPVTANAVRLNISQANEGPTIAEFQLASTIEERTERIERDLDSARRRSKNLARRQGVKAATVRALNKDLTALAKSLDPMTAGPADYERFDTTLASLCARISRAYTANLGFDEIVFVKRKPYSSDHNYSVVYNGTSADRFLAENGLYVYNMRTGKVRPVTTAAQLPGGKGVIGKFSLSFDARKVIFDYRKDTASGFRVWEVNVDGSSLRQLTFPPGDEVEKLARYGVAAFHTDDMHPCYLPDGGIVFTSSRCEHGVLCFTQPNVVTVVLHRMDADGGNIAQLTQSPVSEFSPTILDDGRIMYHRWEYVDKGARVGKTFWAMNPDGSKSEELFGLSDSEQATGAFMYAQQVPGDKSLIVCAVGPHYPQGNSVGPIKLIDLSKDNRTTAPLTNITPEVEIASNQGGWTTAATNFQEINRNGVGVPLYTHPYPVNEKQFLVAHKSHDSDHYMTAGAYGIYLTDVNGYKAAIYEDEDATVSCWHPTPLMARPTPGVIETSRIAALQEENEALCIMANVYEGMDGVGPGAIRYLRINEAIPQYWDTKRKWTPNYHSAQWGAALWPRVQWGIVPVEKDGSAHFTVPADRNIFFQALDENYMEVQRERTYVNYRPGETRSCIGCHERSGRTPRAVVNNAPLALQRPPSIPGPQPGETDPHQVIHYPSDIQPILDAKCISCHGAAEPDADLNLTGGITPLHNVSFEQIRDRGLAGPIIAEFVTHTGGDAANVNGGYLPPRSLGSYTSDLVSTIRTDDSADPHYQLLSQGELLKIIRWVDTNYQFYGTYYGRHHGAHKNHADFRRDPTFEEAISSIAPDWHN